MEFILKKLPMARHSKWHNIKHRKAAQDAKRWKVFTIHAKLITLAAQKWWDPTKNPALADAISPAKKANVPNDNIDRAVKKWTGEDKSAVVIQEIFYEWYVSWGVAVYVRVLSDNKNRTWSNIRHAFTKFWGNMWEPWSVGWMFQRKWIIVIDSSKFSAWDVEELILESWAEDYEENDEEFTVFTSSESFQEIEQFFHSKNVQLESAEISYVPENTVEITEFDKALRVIRSLELFEEDEDVIDVFNNWDISEEIEQEVIEHIEKNSFRT